MLEVELSFVFCAISWPLALASAWDTITPRPPAGCCVTSTSSVSASVICTSTCLLRSPTWTFIISMFSDLWCLELAMALKGLELVSEGFSDLRVDELFSSSRCLMKTWCLREDLLLKPLSQWRHLNDLLSKWVLRCLCSKQSRGNHLAQISHLNLSAQRIFAFWYELRDPGSSWWLWLCPNFS